MNMMHTHLLTTSLEHGVPLVHKQERLTTVCLSLFPAVFDIADNIIAERALVYSLLKVILSSISFNLFFVIL